MVEALFARLFGSRSFAVIIALAAGCNSGSDSREDGDTSATDDQGTAEDDGSGSADETATDDGPDDPPRVGPADAWGRSGLRRLTTAQYTNSVRALLGDQIEIPTVSELEPDVVLSLFANVGASSATTSQRGVEQYEFAAIDLAGQVFANPAWRDELVGCQPQELGCVAGFIERFGEQAFRRPLTGSEIDRYSYVAIDVGIVNNDPWQGLSFAVAAILQSPSFLYIVEIGEPVPSDDGTILRYTSQEMASRLSYFLMDRPPGQRLLDKAASGQLTSKAVVTEETRRILAKPEARLAFRRFFGEYFTLPSIELLVKDQVAFPQASPQLLSAMRKEAEWMTEYVAFESGSLLDIFDTDQTFINADLAALYGLPLPVDVDEDGFGQVTLPASGRAGLLGTGAYLALGGRITRTSPTLRGMFVQSRFMCFELPPPPADADGELPQPPGGPVTMRELLQVHAENPSCATCHDLVDPPGLSLEHYDGIGAYRETDQGLALDVSGTLDDVDFVGMDGLAQTLREHPTVTDCMTRQVYRHAVGQVETAAQEEIVEDLVAELEAVDYDFTEFIVSVVTSDGFRYAGGRDLGEGE